MYDASSVGARWGFCEFIWDYVCNMDVRYRDDLFYGGTLVCKYVSIFVTFDACVVSYFQDDDFMRKPCYGVDYRGYKEFVRAALL